ncbi:MAG: ribonuclease HI, partial [Chloroflexi bacterium]|nr:ribonuclease HI [Chloroflexota bacterium]
MTNLPKVEIWSDGACTGNPGPGGWAAILRSGRYEKVLTGGEKATTNNRMEITAALEGLRALKEPCQVLIYTDSKYLLQGATEWMPNWKA